MPRFLTGLIMAVSILLGGVSPVSAQQSGPLVLAAASLQEAMNAAAARWAAKGHPKPILSFAATSALARQIESGAPADMFISADEKWMTYVSDKGLLRPQTRVTFLTNNLVLIAPVSSRIQLAVRPGFPLARTLGAGRLAMADPDGVPAGRYAKEALTNLGVWPSVEGKLARAENVRLALAFVSRGETPLGIVYSTDAKAEPGVRVVSTFPANSYTPVTYPLAVLKTSKNGETEAFRRFLLSSEGKAIFRRFGFGTK